MPRYKHPITIQSLTITTDNIGNQMETWEDVINCRAQINGIGGKEYYSAATNNAENEMTFEVRYCQALKDITPQKTRIVYNQKIYDVKHIDDYMQMHRSLKIKAVCKLG